MLRSQSNKSSTLRGIKIKNILLWAREKMDIDRFIPDYEYQKEQNREWFVNLVNHFWRKTLESSLVASGELVSKKYIQNKNFSLNTKNEFIEIFKNSKSMPTSRSKAHSYLGSHWQEQRRSRNRRTRKRRNIILGMQE